MRPLGSILEGEAARRTQTAPCRLLRRKRELTTGGLHR